MSDTPRTDAAAFTLVKHDHSSIIAKVVPAAVSREIERENSLMRQTLQAIEERFVDGENTHDDWQFMGETAQKTLDKLPNPDKVQSQ